MGNERVWTSQRNGNWSVTSDLITSPWYDAHAGVDQASLARYPAGGFGSDADTVGGGDSVVLGHDVILDIDGSAGASQQEAGWSPLDFSPTDGSAPTDLLTGTYRAAYTVISPAGSTMGRTSESAAVPLIHGASRPRISWAKPPPAGCSYYLQLTNNSGATGTESFYCSGIAGASVDLVGGNYGNHYVSGIAKGGTLPPSAVGTIGTDVTDRATVAVTILDAGSLTILAGKILTLRGDIIVASNPGSTKDFLILQAGAGFGFDGSLAADPSRTAYRMWFKGGGKIRFQD